MKDQPQLTPEEFAAVCAKMEADLSHIPAIEAHIANIEADVRHIHKTIDRMETGALSMGTKLDIMIAGARECRAIIERIDRKMARRYPLPGDKALGIGD